MTGAGNNFRILVQYARASTSVLAAMILLATLGADGQAMPVASRWEKQIELGGIPAVDGEPASPAAAVGRLGIVADVADQPRDLARPKRDPDLPFSGTVISDYADLPLFNPWAVSDMLRNSAGGVATGGHENRPDGGGEGANLQISIGDLLRALVNIDRIDGRQRPAGRVTAAWPAAPGPPRRQPVDDMPPPGNSAARAALMAPILDAETVTLLTSVIRPTLEPDGLITFSLAGFGRFMLNFSSDIGSIVLIDLERGDVIRFTHPRLAGSSGAGDRAYAGRTPEKRSSDLRSNLFWRILYYMIRAAKEPLVVTGLVILLIFSLVWSLRRKV